MGEWIYSGIVFSFLLLPTKKEKKGHLTPDRLQGTPDT